MEVSAAMIDRLAELARLKVDDTQRETLRSDLARMIGFIEKLQELDTTGIAPLQHLTTEINRLRADEVASTLNRTDALEQSARHDDQYFMVPKVIKK